MFLRHILSVLKWCLITSALMISALLVLTQDSQRSNPRKYEEYTLTTSSPPTLERREFSRNQTDNLSNLGRYLFLYETPIIKEPSKLYTILIWKYGPTLEKRHINHFTNKKFDPFEKCSVKNCKITYNDSEITNADAVLFHLQRIKGVKDLPEEKSPRPSHQRWVFLTDETPFHTFLTPNLQLKIFNGKFNWSMTYRIDSDVPVPYGRTILMSQNEEYSGIEFKKRTDVLVAIMGSNCGGRNHRWHYVTELQKHIDVDIYGHCGTLKCPGHFSLDCDSLQYYKFYLSFENSNCPQYITEKLWWNAYYKNAIPIVMGASREDYKYLLPPKSYINVEDFASPADLARYIIYVNKTSDVYKSYFEWRNYFQISNEHGYFQSQSYHYCRLCEALNYNSREKKVYNKLETFWNKDKCYPRWDES